MKGERAGQVRHQLFIGRDLSERLAALAARPGVTRSSILAEALTAWLDRQGASELHSRFGTRLAGIGRQLGRIERNGQIEIEVLAVLSRYLLASVPPVAEDDEAGRASGRQRFESFTRLVGEAFRERRGSFGTEREP